MREEIQNAVIKSTEIATADHGVLTIWLHLDYGGSGQGFGGYALKNVGLEGTRKDLTGHFIERCMAIAGVDAWEKMPGRPIRVAGTSHHIRAIGALLTDDWFDPKADFLSVEET